MSCFQVKKDVIVDLACGMAVLRGADVFVLGIMGAPAGKSQTIFVAGFVAHLLVADIYIKVSIIINYKTKQPSNLA